MTRGEDPAEIIETIARSIELRAPGLSRADPLVFLKFQDPAASNFG
jgi:hypothetical protein